MSLFFLWGAALISVFIVSLISFVGVITLVLRPQNLQKILLYLVSFSTGALLGGAFLHLLPDIVQKKGFTLFISYSVLGGIIFSFLVEKVIHWRHNHSLPQAGRPASYAYMNLFGDGVHNFIDGLIIGASYLLSFNLGISATLAIIFHEIPQEIGDFGVLVHGGFSVKRALWVNFLTALTAVAGTIVSLILGGYLENITYFLVPFAAGGFLYIAGTDLIPELHKEEKISKSLGQLAGILAGIGVMSLLLWLE